jgi:heme/copper-type cytochrome/quinol oxidase subunit 2
MCENVDDFESAVEYINVTAIKIPEQACLMKKEVSVLIIGTFTFVIVTLTAALLLFSYRWHLRRASRQSEVEANASGRGWCSSISTLTSSCLTTL